MRCAAMWCSVVQCGAVWCSVVQCAVTRCNTVQHTVLSCEGYMHCDVLQRGATYQNATRCNTLQHAATRCNIPYTHVKGTHTRTLLNTTPSCKSTLCAMQRVVVCCNMLQVVAVCCSEFQYRLACNDPISAQHPFCRFVFYRLATLLTSFCRL